ncbi:MAG: hypothetical protein K6C32_00405 [Bacilli bacterium]|nr:hypothetical protein [Bacilli bacterium]
MSEENLTPISKKQFAFFEGIALALIGIVLVLNMWYPARVLTLPFTYLFGVLSYVIYLFVYLEGMFLLFRGKGFKIKFNLRLVGIILTFIALCLIATSFSHMEYYWRSLGNYLIHDLNYIQESHFINLFQEGIGGGFLGAVIWGVLNDVGNIIPFLIGFLLLTIGVVLIFLKDILALFNKKRKERKFNKEENEVPLQEVEISKDNTSNIIKNASIVEKADTTERTINEVKPQSFAPANEMMGQSPHYGTNLQFRNTGVFVPAHFVKGVTPGDNPSQPLNIEQSINNSSSSTPLTSPNKVEPSFTPVIPSMPVEEKKEEVKEIPNPVPVKNEQLTLDFDAPRQFDKKIVTAQPIFNEPTSIVNNNPMPAPEVAPTITNEVKVKQKVEWVPPTSDLLEQYETTEAEELNRKTADERTEALNQFFEEYRVGAEIAGYIIGPSVTRYNVKYKPGVPAKNVDLRKNDIAIRLGGVDCRFEQVVEGSYYSGLEVPNAVITTVSFKDVFDALPDVQKHPLAVAFGKNIEGRVIYADYDKFPHLLVAGTTGSGKSIFINSIITTLIMRNSPDDLKLVLVDPKKVEMLKYRDLPHLLCPVITEPEKAKPLLDKLVEEMNERYERIGSNDVVNISEYNEIAEEKGLDKMPYIVAILDEFGDLVQTCKEISRPIVLLGQKARACGIHICIATQSPTADIITSSIKNNLPAHVALACANYTQSVTILGEQGAEKLLGKGDMLVQSQTVSRVGLARVQGCYISGKEISRVTSYLKEKYETVYDEKYLNLEEKAEEEGQAYVASGGATAQMENSEESKYQSIKAWVMSQQYTSMSRIQGECFIGFNRARRIFNRLVQEGIVEGTSEGNKGSRVLVHDAQTSIDLDDIPTSDEQSEY